MRVHRARCGPLLLALAMAACHDRGPDAPSSEPASGPTVSGHVVDVHLRPVAGVAVRIGGGEALSGSDGHFAISGVTAPYDALLVQPSLKTVTEYRGLTRLDPTLTIPTSSSEPDGTAWIWAEATGGVGFPQPAYRTDVTFASQLPGTEVTLHKVDAATGSYDVQMAWFGTSVLVGTVHALQWSWEQAGWTGSYLPIEYSGYGSTPVLALQTGTNARAQDVALSSIRTTALDAELALPAGWNIAGKRAYAVWPFGGAIQIAYDPSATTQVGYATPDAGAQIVLVAWLAPGDAGLLGSAWAYKTLAPDATGVVIPLAVPPQQIAPPQGTVDPITVGDEFVWTAFEGGVTVFLLEGLTRRYTLVTKGTSATLPDLSAYDLALAPGAYSWSVEGYAPYESVDAAAGAAGFYRAWPMDLASAGDGAASASPRRGVNVQ